MLKGRFPALMKALSPVDLDVSRDVIACGIMLHNMMINFRDFDIPPHESVSAGDVERHLDYCNMGQELWQPRYANAFRVRDQIIRDFF